MPIRFAMAERPSETDAILKLRYDVFCLEENLFQPTEDPRVLDRFDAFSTTRNIMAISDDTLIGSLRVTLDSEAGFPADEYYNFRKFIPDGARPMHAGMFCVREAYRTPRIAISLILMAAYFAISHNVTHVACPINPPIANLAKRVGFDQIDDVQFDPHMGVKFIPTLLDMKNLQDFFITFAERNKLYNFLSSYECMFFRQGEFVVKAGDVGDSAFVIIEGDVEVRKQGSAEVLAEMGQGEVFGELALLTDEIRSADVIAKKDLRTMVLQKDAFLQHLRANPEHAVEMLKNMGARMKTMLMANRV